MKKNYMKFIRCVGAAIPLLFGGQATAQIVQTFTYTGAVQVFTVPSCVASISIEAYGGAGANSNDKLTTNSVGGPGGKTEGVLAVTNGQVLYIYVGGAGSQNGPGGFNGGGSGGNSSPGSGCQGGYAGGGGGASDVRLNSMALSSRVLVAGGGGGSGRDYCNGSCVPCGCGGNGGAGGGTSGLAGQAANSCGFGYPGNNVNGGAPGTQSGAGLGGPGDNGGASGTNGLSNVGGDGGAGSYDVAGGGGGGGYYGGGGGGSASNGSGVGGGGGGGGSSYIGGVTNGATTASVSLGNGTVTLRYYYNGAGVVANAGSNAFCIGLGTTLTASNVLSYTWSTGSNNTSINVQPSTTTSYTVYGTNNLGCISWQVITLTVHPLPTLGGTVSHSLLCVGDAATITANGGNTYTWTAGNVVSNTVAVTPSVTTIYTLEGHSMEGCYNTGTVQVDVNPIHLQVTPDTAICLGKSAQLSANGGTVYLWSTGSPFNKITQSPTTNTVYTVASTDINGCNHQAAVNVTVNPLPNIQATATKTNACKGDRLILTGTGATTYEWKSGSGTVSGATTAVTPSVDVPHSFTLTGTNEFGCSTSKVLLINVGKCTSIEELAASSWPEIFPNPGPGLYSIDLGSVEEVVNIRVVDARGALVSATSSTGKTTVDLRDQADGIYFMHFLIKEQEVKVLRVIKK